MGPINSPPPLLTVYPPAIIQLGNLFSLLVPIALQGLQLFDAALDSTGFIPALGMGVGQ